MRRRQDIRSGFAMSERTRSGIKFISATALGAAVTLALLAYYGAFGGLRGSELAVSLADAFTVPGVIMLGAYALMRVAGLGLFDGVSYTLSYAVHTLIPGMRYRRIDKYYDYKRSREQKRIGGYGFLLLVGAGFVFAGVVFTVIFYLA